MIIYVIDHYVIAGNIKIIGMIESYQSCIWDLQFYGLDDFELVCAGTPENIDLLQEGRMLVRDCDIDGVKYSHVALLNRVELSFEPESGYLLRCYGKGLKSLLTRRVVWEQINADNDFLAAVVYNVLHDNIIAPDDTARAIDNFVAGAPGFTTPKITCQLQGQNIAEWLEEVCTESEIGWDVDIYDGDYMFSLLQGTDRTSDQSTVPPVIFSPGFDNLLSSTYTKSREEYHNAALVGGEGEGTDRVCVGVGTASGLDRYETFIDASDVSSNGEIITMATYKDMLKQAGAEALAEAGKVETFEGEIIPDGFYKLGTDYFLGDVVEVVNGLGIRAKARIIELCYSYDENGAKVSPVFGAWEV